MDQLNTNRWMICRICLKSSSLEMQNIFNPDSSFQDLVGKIRECGGIPVNSSDNLPENICSKCLLLLKAAFKFRTLCQTSHQQLRKILNPGSDRTTESIEDFESYEGYASNSIKRECEDISQDDLVTESDALEFIPIEAGIVAEDSDELAANYIELVDSSQNGDVEYLQDEIELSVTSDQSNAEDKTIQQRDGPEQFTNDNKNDILVLETTNSRDVSQQDDQNRKVIVKRKRKHPGRNSKKCSNTVLSTADGDVTTTFICFHCGNIYPERSKLTLHLKMHNNEKPHECEICHKRFAQTPQLSRHMNSHTGSRPYKCKFCSSSFADPSTCIKHERIHTNERPYKCPSCGKAFSYSNVLKVHMMTHTGEKPFNCETCGKKFAQLHHKKAHERTHNTQSEQKQEAQVEYRFQ